MSTNQNRNQKKASYKEYRQQQEARQRRLNIRLMWITGVVIVAAIALAIVFKPTPGSVEFAYDKLPMMGSPSAPVKIIEFGDYKCPSCQYFSQEIEPQLKKDYIDKGLVSFYFMNFAFIGPDSHTAAMAARSVYEQNKDAFWDYHHAIFNNQGNERIQWASAEVLTDLAKKLGLSIDVDKLANDIKNRTYASVVDEHNATARKAGVNSTPSVFINGKLFERGMDYNALKAEIDRVLKEG